MNTFINQQGYEQELMINDRGEYYISETPDVQTIESDDPNLARINELNEIIENYYIRISSLDIEWVKPISQSCINQITFLLKEIK